MESMLTDRGPDHQYTADFIMSLRVAYEWIYTYVMQAMSHSPMNR